jgi:hypothetical protein
MYKASPFHETAMTGSTTARRIDATSLDGLELAADGACFSLQGFDDAGESWSLSLPTACLQQLILTLPNTALEALRRMHNDNTLRIVYPARSTAVELASDQQTFIVTLRTDDGFHVSFGLNAAQCEAIGESPRNAALLAGRLQQPS